MGSPYTVRVVGAELAEPDIQALRAEVEERLAEISRQMSNYVPDSELSRFNRAPAGQPFPVSPEFARVVRFALDMSRDSNGAFDPTLGPLVNLWGFGEMGSEREVPPESALQAARGRTGWRHVSVTSGDALLKDVPDLALDLGGVGKGFGVDEITELLHRHGLTNTYVAIAGEVRVSGHSPRGDRWHLGISAPVDDWRENDPMAAGVWLSDRALSTSGDYHKFFRDGEGRRWSHILDPRTGRPVRHALAGVSVVAPDSMTADALGTTLFVLGLDEGLAFIDARPEAAGLFILREPDGRFRQVPSARFAEMARYEPLP